MRADVELLAPAGSLDAAKIAIEAGADAIYAGPSSVSMRPRRAEFKNDQIAELIKYVHSKGKRVFVVANIFPKSCDVEYFKQNLAQIYEMGADALVVADLWALRYVKKNFKDIEAHISIQASVSNVEAATFYEKNGADVIVMARSMPDINDIKKIRSAVSARLEVFIHGGICFMYDGNCYMSSYYKQKVAYDEERQINRTYGQNNTKGECHLVCKRNYDLNDNGSVLAKGRLMRRPDQIGLTQIPLFIESGANIFKIEGRAMATDYVEKSVRLYREAIDSYLESPSLFEASKDWLERAEDLKEYRLDYERKWNIK
ncbi:MAG TPA: U32 family peptidase [Actinobacteria bacterium]|nr:U32 family peptidase [Actinomycetota bacterium]